MTVGDGPANAVLDAPRKKVAILVNTIAPYRIPLYQRIGDEFDTYLVPSGPESNRAAWGDPRKGLKGVTVLASAGLTRRYRLGGERVYEERFFHAPLGNLATLLRLRPDAVVTNEMGIRTLLALLYGTLLRKPVRVWWGGTLHTERGIGTPRRIVRWLIARWARRWISYGETSTEYLLSLGIDRSRILQIQNCVDERPYRDGSARPDHSAEPPVFLCVGRLVRIKGVDLFLQVAATLQAEGHRFTLRFIGEGPEGAAFEQLATDLGLAGVEFLPGRRPAEMPAAYRDADFLVFPTLNDVWGLVVNEALWSGLPVLASKFAGCASELLPADRVFDPLDPESFEAILRAALEGGITGTDTTPLLTCREVGDRLVAAIARDLESSRA